jgi:glycosyltransferase involved in cell wall biosynthesis
MKIALLGYAAVLPANGAASYARNLGHGLVRHRHEVVLLTQPAGQAPDPSALRLLPIAGKRLAPFGGARFAVAVLAHFLRHGRRERFDILHSFSASPVIALLGAAAARLAGIPSVHTALSRPDANWQFHFNDLLTYSFGGTAPKHRRAIPIPPPLDLEPYTLARRQRKATPYLRIGFMGPPIRRKGLHVLLESLPDVLAAQPGLTVRLAISLGQARVLEEQQGDLASVRRFIDERGLAKNVELVGDVDPPRFLSEIDLLVFPAQSPAGLLDPPLTVVEAMAAGCAVLTTCVGSLPDLLNQGASGFLVKAGREADATAYTQILKQLAADPGIVREKGLLAAEQVSEFASDRVAALFEEQYARLV